MYLNRKYDQAIKSYKQALKLSPDNMQILRDITVLQMQVQTVYMHFCFEQDLLKPRSSC